MSSHIIHTNHPDLGALTIDTVYFYYDGPRLFTVRSETGRVFMVSSAAETDHAEIFLCAPITPKQIEQVLSITGSMRDFLLGAEQGFLYVLSLSTHDRETTVNVGTVSVTELSEDWLPAQNPRAVAHLN